jgi:nickel/cobalt transporter (NicO) family protein
VTGRRLLLGVAAAAAVVLLPAGAASAHPLGNFTVNHLDQLGVHADGVTILALVDLAEIPTAQADSDVDADGNGDASSAERDAYARVRCGQAAGAQVLTIDGVGQVIGLDHSRFEYTPGQAGLATSRLECSLRVGARLTEGSTIRFRDDFAPGRIGWREVVAVGDGVELRSSDVPTASVTDGLRSYPGDQQDAPPQVIAATVVVGAVGGSPPAGGGGARNAVDRLGPAARGSASGPLERLQQLFEDLVGRRDLTLPVGLLAVGLAMLLGTSHALLPGHGKTIMAAYIAGSEGTTRDAVLVGATVTGTHTSGVLLLGLALTLSTALAGETVIGWLGVASGAFLVGLGVALLVGTIRRGGGSRWSLETHHHGPFGGHAHGHTHAHDGHAHDGHAHAHAHAHAHDGHVHVHGPGDDGHLVIELDDELDHDDLLELHDELVHVHAELAHHEHADGHEHAGPATGGPGGHAVAGTRTATAADGPGAHRSGTGPPSRATSRLALVGMGAAGGLVPSPSALVILLSAIALGRTAFGVLLVLAYGIGMAVTLTAAGVLLVHVRDRWVNRFTQGASRWSERWGRVMPYATSALIVVVGAGLAVRSLLSL